VYKLWANQNLVIKYVCCTWVKCITFFKTKKEKKESTTNWGNDLREWSEEWAAGSKEWTLNLLYFFLLCKKRSCLDRHPAVPEKNGIYGIFWGTRCGVALND